MTKTLQEIRNRMNRLVEDLDPTLAKLDKFSREVKTYEDCLRIIEQDPRDFMYIPERFIDYDLALKAIKQSEDAFLLRNVPINLIDYPMCLEAIKGKRMNNLEYIPNRFKTEEICSIAVNNYGSNLEFVPEKLKTEKMCEDALRAEHYGSYAIPYIPKDVEEKLKKKYNVNDLSWLA